MYFVRSGYVYSGFGSLRRASVNGIYLSGTAFSGLLQSAYYLDFDNVDTYPTGHDSWVYGFSIKIFIYFHVFCA